MQATHAFSLSEISRQKHELYEQHEHACALIQEDAEPILPLELQTKPALPLTGSLNSVKRLHEVAEALSLLPGVIAVPWLHASTGSAELDLRLYPALWPDAYGELTSLTQDQLDVRLLRLMCQRHALACSLAVLATGPVYVSFAPVLLDYNAHLAQQHGVSVADPAAKALAYVSGLSCRLVFSFTDDYPATHADRWCRTTDSLAFKREVASRCSIHRRTLHAFAVRFQEGYPAVQQSELLDHCLAQWNPTSLSLAGLRRDFDNLTNGLRPDVSLAVQHNVANLTPGSSYWRVTAPAQNSMECREPSPAFDDPDSKQLARDLDALARRQLAWRVAAKLAQAAAFAEVTLHEYAATAKGCKAEVCVGVKPHCVNHPTPQGCLA